MEGIEPLGSHAHTLFWIFHCLLNIFWAGGRELQQRKSQEKWRGIFYIDFQTSRNDDYYVSKYNTGFSYAISPDFGPKVDEVTEEWRKLHSGVFYTRVSQMKNSNIFFTCDLLNKSGTQVYHFST
jgi:hypothetical protein